MTVAFAVVSSHDFLGLAGQTMNFFRRQHASFLQNFLLLGRQSLGDFGFVPLEGVCLAAGKFLDLFADANAAPVVTTHGAEVGIHVQIFVVIRASCVRIEAQFKVLGPVQCGTRFSKFIIAVASPRDSQRHVGRMCRDLVSDAALLHIVFLGKSQMFLWRHVTQHAGPVPGSVCGSDAAGDMVVTRKNVGDQRPQHIKRSPVAQATLQLHVEFDLVQRHVARTFDHHLHTFSPRSFCEFSQSR